MEDTLKEIRIRLRLAMNGIISTSMREKGMQYKLIFGVPLPEIKKIATSYPPNPELAEKLWEQDVREMKILALLLYPPDSFTWEKAEQWGKQVSNQEIAEIYPLYLLQNVSYASKLAKDWIQKDSIYFQAVGFLLYSRMFIRGLELPLSEEIVFLKEAKKQLDKIDDNLFFLQRSVLAALKRFGRKGKYQAEKVLKMMEDFQNCRVPEKEEFYNDIKFEFEYYL